MIKKSTCQMFSICLIKRGWSKIPRNISFESTRAHVTPFSLLLVFDPEQASFAVLIYTC